MTEAKPVVLTRKSYGGIALSPISESKSGVRIGIYGPGGTGKTTLAGTVVKSEWGGPALYLDARGNPEVIRSYGEQIQVITLASFKQIEMVRKDLIMDSSRPFKSVILDNLSEMHAMCLRDLYGETADVDWRQHAAATADMLQLARNWSDLATIHGLNIIFIMWETPETRTIREQEVSRSEIAFSKSLQAQLPGIISWLGRLYIVDDEEPYTRCLDFRPIETMHQAKFQIDPNEPNVSQIPMEMYNPSLASVLDTIKGGMPFPIKAHSKPKTKLDQFLARK